VILATGISKQICEKINLGYRNPAEINRAEWENGDSEGKLFVPDAGETLYQLLASIPD
jgi:lactate racemase